MKIIGLLGGMSWESSAIYYETINKRIKEKLGGHHSAEILMYSIDFQLIKDLQHQGNWKEATKIMVQASQRIEKAGADFLVIGTNTMHMMAEQVQESIKVPLLHIADATANKIKSDQIQKVGLLATKFTMEENFYKGRLSTQYGIDVIIPSDEERNVVHQIIYDELCLGNIKQSSKTKYIEVMKNLITNGAQAIILGCTEITMLVNQQDISVPLYDTTDIHAKVAADYSIRE